MGYMDSKNLFLPIVNLNVFVSQTPNFTINFILYSSLTQENSTATIGTEFIQIDKLKLIQAIKEKFKILLHNKEPGMRKPFLKILRLLSQNEFSRSSFHDLSNTWRNMQCVASLHQKKGIVSEIDRRVLNLRMFIRKHENYDETIESSSDDQNSEENIEKNMKHP